MLVVATLALAALAADAPYVSEIEKWRAAREERLKADGGWLTVTGLFWLKDGANTFGSDKANDIVLPASVAPKARRDRVRPRRQGRSCGRSRGWRSSPAASPRRRAWR